MKSEIKKLLFVESIGTKTYMFWKNTIKKVKLIYL